MLHHITLWVPDLARAERSWSWLLEQLDYVIDRSVPGLVLFRHGSRFAIALEQSSDMVPGMLYSRMRPGLNHIAFTVESAAALEDIADRAAGYGWRALPASGHPIAGGARVAYIEDGDGFEIELVVPDSGPPDEDEGLPG